jgi:hypothetical protein
VKVEEEEEEEVVADFGAWTTVSTVVKTVEDLQKDALKIEKAQADAVSLKSHRMKTHSAVNKLLKLEKKEDGDGDGDEDALKTFNPFGGTSTYRYVST